MLGFRFPVLRVHLAFQFLRPSDFLMTFGSLLFAVFVGWRLKKAEVIQEIPRPIYFIVKWIVPAVIVAIFVSNLAMK